MYNYNDAIILSDAGMRIHEKDRKRNLSTLEKIGLEKILCDFVSDYEETTYGETYGDLSAYTRYNDSSVDILDGYTDTYIFDHYAICEIWVTNNGGICLTCMDLSDYIGNNPDAYEDVKDDLCDLPSKFDLYADFEPVVFKLN